MFTIFKRNTKPPFGGFFGVDRGGLVPQVNKVLPYHKVDKGTDLLNNIARCGCFIV